MRVPVSRFSVLTPDLIEKVRTWRNKNRIRLNMLDDRLIEPGAQRTWFENLKYCNDRSYRVFLQDNRPIGMLYFTNIERTSCEWGCYIGEEACWPGSGVLLEIAALDFAFEKLSVTELNARVFAGNHSPIKLHERFGYKQSSVTEVTTRLGHKKILISFNYKKNDWLKNRLEIITSLPAPIFRACQLFNFE